MNRSTYTDYFLKPEKATQRRYEAEDSQSPPSHARHGGDAGELLPPPPCRHDSRRTFLRKGPGRSVRVAVGSRRSARTSREFTSGDVITPSIPRKIHRERFPYALSEITIDRLIRFNPTLRYTLIQGTSSGRIRDQGRQIHFQTLQASH